MRAHKHLIACSTALARDYENAEIQIYSALQLTRTVDNLGFERRQEKRRAFISRNDDGKYVWRRRYNPPFLNAAGAGRNILVMLTT
jgi:hypothetical protein